VFHRMVVAGLLALGAGMAWGDPAAVDETTAGLHFSAAAVSNNSTLLRGVNFNGVVFPVDARVLSDIDLTQVDGAMYYELSDDETSFDVGVALRWVDSRMRMTAAEYADVLAFDGFMPLLYGRLRLELPWDSMYVAAQVEGADRDNERLLDANLLVGWTSPTGLGVETGYRHYRLKLIDYDQLENLDIDLRGPYVAVYLHF
jgi:outer membrane protein